MKPSRTIEAVTVASCVLLSSNALAAITPYREIDWSDGWQAFREVIEGRLELGTRSSQFALDTDSTAPTEEDAFLGRLYKLNAEQNAAPTKIFADFNIIEYWGVEWTWDEMAATPINFNRDVPPFGDGKVTVGGPILATYGRYPFEINPTFTVVPFVGLGYAFWKSSFDEDTWWAYGYGSPDDLAADPDPGPQPNGRRIETADDPTGFIYLGADLFFTRHWAAQLYYRKMDMNIDAAFYLGDEPRDTGSFPMSSTWWAFGVKYAF